jgi:hypothetical protein
VASSVLSLASIGWVWPWKRASSTCGSGSPAAQLKRIAMRAVDAGIHRWCGPVAMPVMPT